VEASPFRSRAAGLATTPGAPAGLRPRVPPSWLALAGPEALSSRASAGPPRGRVLRRARLAHARGAERATASPCPHRRRARFAQARGSERATASPRPPPIPEPGPQ